MSNPEAPTEEPAVQEKSLDDRLDVSFVTDDLSARCSLGTHPAHGVYFQGIQCKKGSVYPYTGTAWSEKGDRGPGICHNPENPLILPIWEWMKDVGFTDEQMLNVKKFLAEKNLLDVVVGKSNVDEANM